MRQRGMNRLAGIAGVYDALIKNVAPDSIIASWQLEQEEFLEIREKYLMYE